MEYVLQTVMVIESIGLFFVLLLLVLEIHMCTWAIHNQVLIVTRYEKTDHFEKSANVAILAVVDAQFNQELKNVKMKA